jgi:hypothetical protein
VDHIEYRGVKCSNSLASSTLNVANPKTAAYRANLHKSPWIKIKNPAYSQKEGRENYSSDSSARPLEG